jgi:hypothetical protein
MGLLIFLFLSSVSDRMEQTRHETIQILQPILTMKNKD